MSSLRLRTLIVSPDKKQENTLYIHLLIEYVEMRVKS